MERFTLSLTVLLSGLIVVFFALIALIFIIKACGKIIGKFEGNLNNSKKDNNINNISTTVEYIENSVDDNISEEIVAAISAAVYSIYGPKQKIHSVRRVKKSNSNRPIWGSVGVIDSTRPF